MHIFSIVADCQPWEFECPCGSPRCISQSLVSNGVLDCADGADEGKKYMNIKKMMKKAL